MPSAAQRQRASSQKREGNLIVRLVFAPFLIGGLAVLWIVTLGPLWRIAAARTWERIPCRILTSELETVPGDDLNSYRVKMTYSYNFYGERHTSSRFDFSNASSNARETKAQAVAAHPAGSMAECFVNPRQPQEAVIDRAPHAELAWGLVGLPFAAVGLLTFVRLPGSVRFVPYDKSEKILARERRRKGKAAPVTEQEEEQE